MADKTFTTATLSSADVNTYLSHTGDAWNSWTPVLTQSGMVTATVTRATYHRTGRRIEVCVRLDVTGTGTGGVAINLSLPVTAAASAVYGAGTCTVTDVSASADYGAQPYLNTTTSIVFLSSSSSAANRSLGVTTMTAGLASGDVVTASFSYEAAS